MAFSNNNNGSVPGPAFGAVTAASQQFDKDLNDATPSPFGVHITDRRTQEQKVNAVRAAQERQALATVEEFADKYETAEIGLAPARVRRDKRARLGTEIVEAEAKARDLRLLKQTLPDLHDEEVLGTALRTLRRLNPNLYAAISNLLPRHRSKKQKRENVTNVHCAPAPKRRRIRRVVVSDTDEEEEYEPAPERIRVKQEPNPEHKHEETEVVGEQEPGQVGEPGEPVEVTAIADTETTTETNARLEAELCDYMSEGEYEYEGEGESSGKEQ